MRALILVITLAWLRSTAPFLISPPNIETPVRFGARGGPWEPMPVKWLQCALGGSDADIGAELLTRAEALSRAVAFPLTFAAAFRVGAAISVVGQPRLPLEVPGPFNTVGSRVVRLPGEGGARIRLFYPCDPPTEGILAQDAPYCTDGRATSDGMAGLVGFRQLGLSFLLAHLAGAASGCIDGAAPAAAAGRLPLLVLSATGSAACAAAARSSPRLTTRERRCTLMASEGTWIWQRTFCAQSHRQAPS
jgi:hypothetical protein